MLLVVARWEGNTKSAAAGEDLERGNFFERCDMFTGEADVEGLDGLQIDLDQTFFRCLIVGRRDGDDELNLFVSDEQVVGEEVGAVGEGDLEGGSSVDFGGVDELNVSEAIDFDEDVGWVVEVGAVGVVSGLQSDAGVVDGSDEAGDGIAVAELDAVVELVVLRFDLGRLRASGGVGVDEVEAVEGGVEFAEEGVTPAEGFGGVGVGDI